MFHVYSSNQLEQLISTLSDIVRNGLPDPFTAEQIVVQSKGMERWLSIQLAERLGVWANAEFPFPNSIIWRLFRQGLGQLPETSLFEREIMLWQFMDMLPECLQEAEFKELKHYLHDDPQGVKLFQLSLRIADIFDQYTLYRPEMLFAWEQGEQTAGWQSALWCKLIERYGHADHRGRLWQRFMQVDPKQLTNLPARLFIFGIPNLPPVYLQMLARLGDVIDVHLFLFNPCQEHWGYIVSESDMARLARRHEGHLVSPEAQYYEKGNSLLASMGRMAKEFFDLIHDYAPQAHDLFLDPSEDNLLHCLQSDILQLHDRLPNPSFQLNPADKSLQLHVCHSAMREVEVLHDQLLALFDADPTLLPRDIVVMMPNVEDYAPFIEAVFAVDRDPKQHLPFSIADRGLRSESSLIDTFIAILELERSRFVVPEVLAILETEAVQQRFNLALTDLTLVKRWIQQTAIRWGMDAESREQLSLPPFAENTWRAGLDRLLLGFALPSQGIHLFQDILPFDEIEGQETLVLGKLSAFVEQLFTVMNALSQDRSPHEWAQFLSQLLDQFFKPNEAQEAEAQAVREILQQLHNSSEQGQFAKPIGISTVIAYLRNYLEGVSPPLHFLTGQITFCTLLPMRSIPFRVVCLLGMNDHSYPRVHRPLGFDLIAQKPKKGDRSLRHNDRYLFLEALLSARDLFYISYVGYSIQDNSEKPPSVLVSELQDYIEQGFTETTLAAITDHHPLQPFSPRYFAPEQANLFSYSEEYCQASKVLLGERSALTNCFFTEILPEPEDSWRMVELEQLVRFFGNPAKFLLRERLGIWLEESSELLAESEPFFLDYLADYQFKQGLIENALAEQDLSKQFQLARAHGILPHGHIGEVVYQRTVTEIKAFVAQVKSATADTRLAPQAVHLEIDGFQLSARLGQVWPEQQVFYRYASLKGKDYLKLWFYHLVLNYQANQATAETLPRVSCFVGKDQTVVLEAVPNPELLLAELLNWYWQGCCRPLAFFPKSALTYISIWEKKQNAADALDKAESAWRGSDMAAGEIDDVYFQQVYQHQAESPLTEEFVELTQGIFGRLWQARQKG